MKTLLLFCMLCTLAVFSQTQDTIYVPGDTISSIQAGIYAADSGDIVLVADGTYNEQINFLGKPITVASWYLRDGNEDHIDNTVIDGGNIPVGDSCSVVYFVNDEDTTSVLCGFTIQHGKGTYFNGDYTGRWGGGILMAGSGAKIIHNHITANNFSDTTFQSNMQLSYGGGIFVSGDDDVNDWLLLEHNIIDHNYLYSINLQAGGAGFWIDNTNAVIANNVIDDNKCSATMNSTAIAAALGVHSSNDEQITINVESNIFTNNSCYAANSWAACACADCENATVIFSGNKVENNVSSSIVNNGSAGALTFNDPGPGSIISNNIFKANISPGVGGAVRLIPWHPEYEYQTVIIENNYFQENECTNGGAIWDNNIPVVLQNNVFSGNHASSNGGAALFVSGAFNQDIHMATLINNTFSGNEANAKGGAVYSSKANMLIINSIFWNDSSSSPEHNEFYINNADTAEIAYSDIDPSKIYGTWIDGEGNINEDPLFFSPDSLIIMTDSPCLDAGTDVFTCECGVTNYCPEYDILSIPRPQSGASEMGAYELIFEGIPNFGCNMMEVSIYPNPVYDQTTFTFNLEKNTFVTISILDIQGRLIDMPFTGWQQQGGHQLTFDAANLPSGIYFYRIQAGNVSRSGKMVVSR